MDPLGRGNAMRTVPPLCYEARLVAGFAGLLPCLGLPAYAVLSRLLWGRFDAEIPLPMIVNAFEIILPLAAGLSAAHLMTIETEEGFSELRRSYPESRLCLPLLRSGSALGFLFLALTVGAFAFPFLWGAYDVFAAVLPSLAPALFLTGLSLLIGGLSRSYWAAAGVVLVYWFLELQTRGKISGTLFLFATVWNWREVSYPLNRSLLAGLGFAFFVINAAWYAYRNGGSIRRSALGER